MITIRMCDVYGHVTYLILPWNGHTAGVELAIEGIVRGVQIDTFYRGELLNVQYVFGVNRARL